MVISSIINYLNYSLSFPSVNAKPCFVKTYKIFVYGTLKRGEVNNKWLTNPNNGVAIFITEAKTRKRYPLIIATKYNMPFLLNLPGRGCIIDGDIYDVNVPMLGKLDKLINPALYSRNEADIAIKLPNGATETMRCHVYFLNEPLMTEELLNRRSLGNYKSNGKHGLPYKSNTTATAADLEDPIPAY